MPVVRLLPEGRDISFEEGADRTLLDILAGACVLIESDCGGKGTCGKCAVELVRGTLEDPGGGPAPPVRGTLYLACQSVPSGDVELRVAHGPLESIHLERLISGGINLAPGAAGKAARLGVAVDVGTTTVVGLLADLDSGAPLAVESEDNPQRSYGADVISRIGFSRSEKGTKILQQAVVGAINHIIARMCEKSGQEALHVESVVCAGNTAMQHFLLGIAPRHLGCAPYEAEFHEAPPRPAVSIGLDLPDAASLEVLPNIRSFIGADTVGCLLSIEREGRADRSLMVDMGTNTEIVLWRGGDRVACSAAAGPAFEGAHLTHGMRATPGAINAAWLQGRGIAYRSVAGAPPLGICGSGIVDVVAALRRLEVVEKSGRMRDYQEYVLVRASKSGTGRAITVTRGDIREIQLVKASIATGISVLLDALGIGYDELERFYVAGAFGNYLDIENARYVGLLPNLPPNKFVPIGDAALEGAYITLTGGEDARARASTIAQGTSHIELAARPDFQARFIDNLNLDSYPNGGA
jgi:uncharacterized 2Fe-2S/4Fe-4S cluster protein (DUF4445 family)